jgi:8-oxo-dGTP pyrophosphatase MutT (NUDIX family)
MKHLHDDARVMLQAWQPGALDQIHLREEYLTFLALHSDAMSRACREGHLTASAMVMNQSRDSVLLTLHPKVGRWLQLGGHLEQADASVRTGAIREVLEEGGLPPLWVSGHPIRLDRHPVPCGGQPSVHFDVQFLTIVDEALPFSISDESLDLQWWALTDLPMDLDNSVQALIADCLSVTLP